jgi:CHAT domain-containing protein
LTDVSRPLAGALLLGDDVPLSLADVLAQQLELRLTVLSACETGRLGTELPDEVVSLPTGLLQAGAAGVIASGWAVPDASTAALMVDFYRRWRQEKRPPGEALAAAQAWLRGTTNGEKVDFWERALEEGASWLPPDAADELLDAYLVREPDALDDAGLDVWAGFAHFGC